MDKLKAIREYKSKPMAIIPPTNKLYCKKMAPKDLKYTSMSNGNLN